MPTSSNLRNENILYKPNYKNRLWENTGEKYFAGELNSLYTVQ